ncbi:MAG: histidine kinase [Bacteroidota bacterium]
MTIKSAIQVAVFFSFAISSMAQIDSLKRILPATGDTQRVNILNRLSGLYLEKYITERPAPGSFNLGMDYANQALELATSINYRKGIGESLYSQGNALSMREGHLKSLGILQNALPLLKQSSEPGLVASCMQLIADDLHALAKLSQAILYYDSSKILFFELKDSGNAVYSMMMKGHCNYDLGNYKDAYTFGEAADRMATKVGSIRLQTSTRSHLASLFLGADLPQNTIDYMRQVLLLNYPEQVPIGLTSPVRWALNSGGEAFLKLHQVDSADKIARLQVIDSAEVSEMLFRGKLAAAQHKYNEALSFFEQGYHFSRAHDHPMALSWHANEMAHIYQVRHDYKKALQYAHEALRVAQQVYALKEIRNANTTLSDIYGEMKDYTKAFYFGKQAKSLGDSLVPDEYRRVLSLIQVQNELTSQQQQVRLLSKDNQLKESNLYQERTIRNGFIAALIAVMVIAVLIIWNIMLRKKKDQAQRLMNETNTKLENKVKEQKLAELEREKANLEMQALRAQMNPHFIFNCLSSINRFILKNETDAASDYLTKFSRLIRMVLVNSKKTFILLDDELETLRLYLDMERLRFKDSFDYCITFINSVELGSIFIPPLLLQPFAENAIWHGLMHKEGPKKLTIDLAVNDDFLYCVITDNGVGRQKAGLMKSKFSEKQKSLGLQITKDRLALLNYGINESFFFNIEDLIDDDEHAAGTRVTVKINRRNGIENNMS